MTLNPVETLNVFHPELRKELRSRSLSKNLVRVRAPFLRFTTATDMSNISNLLGGQFENYANGKFFTLGLHGWDNKDYSAADLYGTQSDKGLVVGTTYNQSNGQQLLVHTQGGVQRIITPSSGGGTTVQKNENYPPPGITSAKVERLRNGNVLKFILEIQCYTQEQLEVLDAICFIPGMTCILEWGNIYTTPDKVEGLPYPDSYAYIDTNTGNSYRPQILNFKTAQVETDIRLAIVDSRSNFINKWCIPNRFNYDFAVANIANVKTTLQNNVYNISVVAYGRADNLLYVSAYATSNPLDPSQVQADQAVVKSVSEYFKINGPFSTHLKDNVNNSAGDILKFYDTVNRAEQPSTVPTSTDSGTTNDLGLEDSYFISFRYFVDEILNNQVLAIIKSGTNNEVQLNRLITPLQDGPDVIRVGYNEYLRSSNPETMIIFNDTAISKANKRISNLAQQSGLISQLRRADGEAYRLNPNRSIANVDEAFLGAMGAEGAAERQTTYDAMRSRKFGSSIPVASSVTTLLSGVWLNSKGIQSAFINARTIMEGLETLLRNINSATENYWDLKLFYDDDRQEFRILDDNVRELVDNTDNKIYEFNKRLSTVDTDTIGPDVLDIQVATDYPKMLFSQLAVSGINGGNLVNSPERRDADFVSKRLNDIFAKKSSTPQPASAKPPLYPAGTLSTTDLAKTLSSQLYGNSDYANNITNLLTPFSVGGATGVPPQVANFIMEVFNNRNLMSVAVARSYRNQFDTFRRDSLITTEQAASITALFGLRAKAIIARQKNREISEFESSFYAFNRDYAGTRIPLGRIQAIISSRTGSIRKSQAKFEQLIDSAVGQAATTVGATQAQRQQENSQARGEGGITTSLASR